MNITAVALYLTSWWHITEKILMPLWGSMLQWNPWNTVLCMTVDLNVSQGTVPQSIIFVSPSSVKTQSHSSLHLRLDSILILSHLSNTSSLTELHICFKTYHFYEVKLLLADLQLKMHSAIVASGHQCLLLPTYFLSSHLHTTLAPWGKPPAIQLFPDGTKTSLL